MGRCGESRLWAQRLGALWKERRCWPRTTCSSSGSSACRLCDLGQVADHLCALVFLYQELSTQGG